MRKQEDGDIKPTKEDIESAEQLFTDLLELVGEHSEYTDDFRDSIKSLKRRKKRAK